MTARIAAWLHERHLSHPLLALAVMVPFAAADTAWIGAALATGFYLGREVRTTEERLFGRGYLGGRLRKHGVLYGLRGFDLRNWSADSHWDFWPVVAVCALVALV